MQGRNTTGGSEDMQMYDGSTSLPQFSRQHQDPQQTSYNKQIMPLVPSDDSNNQNNYMTTLGPKDNNTLQQPSADLQVQFTNLVTTVRATRANNDQGPAHQMDFDEVEDDFTQVQKPQEKTDANGRPTTHGSDQLLDLPRPTNETEMMSGLNKATIRNGQPQNQAQQQLPSLNHSMQSANSQNNQQQQESQQQIRLSFRQSEPIQAVNASFSHNNSKIHEKAAEKDTTMPSMILNSVPHQNSQTSSQPMLDAPSQITQPQAHYTSAQASPHPLPHLLSHGGGPGAALMNRSQMHQSNITGNNKSNILDVSAPFTDNLNYDLDIVQDDAIDHETVSMGRLMSLRNMPNYHRTIKRADWGSKAKGDKEAPIDSLAANMKKQQILNQDKNAQANESWARNMPPHPNKFRVQSPGRGRATDVDKQAMNQRTLGLFEAARSTDKTFVSNEKAPEVIIRHENNHHLSAVLNYFNTEAKNPNRQGQQNVDLQEANKYNQRSARILQESTQQNMLGLATPARDHHQAGQVAHEQPITVNPLLNPNPASSNENNHQIQDQSYSQLLSHSQLANQRDDNLSVNRHTVPVFEPASVRIVAYRQTEYTEVPSQAPPNKQMVEAGTNTEPEDNSKDDLIKKMQTQMQILEKTNSQLTLQLSQKESMLASTQSQLDFSLKNSLTLASRLNSVQKKFKTRIINVSTQLQATKQSWHQAASNLTSDLSSMNFDLEGQMQEVATRAQYIAKKQQQMERIVSDKDKEIERLMALLHRKESEEQSKKTEIEGKEAAVQVQILDQAVKQEEEKMEEEGYQNSDQEEEEEDEDEKDGTHQKNPVFDKYVDTQLLVGTQPKPSLKSSAKLPTDYVEKNSSNKHQDDKEEQVKTTYYALATGKSAPKDKKKGEDDEDSEQDDDEDDEDDDGHTFKTITEKPFEEDQVTTVQNSVSRARMSHMNRGEDADGQTHLKDDADEEQDAHDRVSSDHTQEKDFLNNESLKAAGIASPQTIEAQEGEQFSQKSRKSIESKVSKKTERSYDYSVKTQQQQTQQQNEQKSDASEKFQQDFSNLKAKFESILKKDDEIRNLNNEIEKSTRSYSRGRRSQVNVRGNEEDKQVCSRPHSQQVQQQSSRLFAAGDQCDKQDESCTSDERREVLVKDMMSDKDVQDGILKRVEGLMPTEQQQQIPISLTLNRHQGIVRTTRVTVKPAQQRVARKPESKESSDESDEDASKQSDRASEPKASSKPVTVTSQSNNLDLSKVIIAKAGSQPEPDSRIQTGQTEHTKSGRVSPEQMRTPMVIELNNDDSDISPMGGQFRDQQTAEDFEAEKFKFTSKDGIMMALQNEPNHQKDFQISTSLVDKDINLRGPQVPSVSFGSSGVFSANESTAHQVEEEYDKTQKTHLSPQEQQEKIPQSKAVPIQQEKKPITMIEKSEKPTVKGSKGRQSFSDLDMEILAEENEVDESSPSIDAKIMHATLGQDNKTKFNNVFQKHGHRMAPADNARNSPNKIRTFPSPVNKSRPSDSPPTFDKVAEPNKELQDDGNNTAASIVQWRSSNISNDAAGPRVSTDGPLASNAPSSVRGKSDAGLGGSFDEEIEHSPPRKSIQNLNSSEKKQTSIQKQQENQRQQSPTPRKSSSSNNSGNDGDDVSDEEDSHLITITERTYEESCTCLNSSQVSQVSVSQMIMDDIKQKLQNKNNQKARKSDCTSSAKKTKDDYASDKEDITVGNEPSRNMDSQLQIDHQNSTKEKHPFFNEKVKEDQHAKPKIQEEEKNESDQKANEGNRFETLLNDVQSANLRSSVQSNYTDVARTSIEPNVFNISNNQSFKQEQTNPNPSKGPSNQETDEKERHSRMTGNLENYKQTDFGEFEKNVVDRQIVKPALTNIVSPAKHVTPIQQALKRGILNPSTSQMLQKQAAIGHQQSLNKPGSIQNIHPSQQTQKKATNKYFASTHPDQDRYVGGQVATSNQLMNQSVAVNNHNDSITTKPDDQAKQVNKSQQSGWQTQSQQSLSLLTPLQILSLASSSERDTSNNNLNSQYLAFNDTSLNTTKNRGSAVTVGNEGQHQELNNSRASQRSKRRQTENNVKEDK